jgi:predicted ATP-grasp superfamily ATP-dependent carboligase
MVEARDHQLVLLAGEDHLALTIVRELGQRCVKVHCIAPAKISLCRFSRYTASFHERPDTVAATLALVRSVALQTDTVNVMSYLEQDIALLHRHAKELAGLRLLIPRADRMRLVDDKSETLRLAQTIGIDVPRCWPIRDSLAVKEMVGDIHFPCVLKWSDPLEVEPLLLARGIPLLKSQYAYSLGELEKALRPYDPIGVYPLVQQYCPGVGLDHVIFMHRGDVLLRLQHCRRHEWPPEGGRATFCESVPLEKHAVLFKQSVALLRLIDWEGPAQVEYRYDPNRDHAVLMEVNGRFWGTLPLEYHSNAPFVWYTFALLGLGQVPEGALPKTGLRARHTNHEAKRLYRILFERDKIENRDLRYNLAAEVLFFIASFLDPRNRDFIYSSRDPLPFLHFALRKIRSGFRALFGRAG